ncbi:hypothetical protein D3C84_865790 [compost metagenome]
MMGSPVSPARPVRRSKDPGPTAHKACAVGTWDQRSIWISTRRFIARPSLVELSATGWLSPAPPTLTMLEAGIPLRTR